MMYRRGCGTVVLIVLLFTAAGCGPTAGSGGASASPATPLAVEAQFALGKRVSTPRDGLTALGITAENAAERPWKPLRLLAYCAPEISSTPWITGGYGRSWLDKDLRRAAETETVVYTKTSGEAPMNAGTLIGELRAAVPTGCAHWKTDYLSAEFVAELPLPELTGVNDRYGFCMTVAEQPDWEPTPRCEVYLARNLSPVTTVVTSFSYQARDLDTARQGMLRFVPTVAARLVQG
ncbi:hypothetical protein Lfu02_62360 [Longispora fulva]|uniref:PknH-like extracellular domain-containing protein n=1 Tax=Longispora fulva TaxID=619741 RepID=A0A8J7GPT1_9ACTN|nr:hypothetical protein [Longispora fulva]MBG6134656.1 hypothetical protein [Longispora fulva]GIG61864.1 hypothetical protein Lfu02_62360 [Longispora fulva]